MNTTILPEDHPTPIRPLNLDDSPITEIVSPDTCIAHLKFLASLSNLRDTISATDGLFTVFNDKLRSVPLYGGMPYNPKAQEVALCREKRWEIYVCRAVERFTVWLQSVIKADEGLGGRSLGMISIATVESGEYATWTGCAGRVKWGADGVPLPPLDVLMVWHAYMLNPRDFLEDCLRTRKMSFWATGMPWKEINACIDNVTLDYDPGETVKAAFTISTGFPWDNLDGPECKISSCPRCHSLVQLSWTDSKPYTIDSVEAPFQFHKGYADTGFSAYCVCGWNFTHESLCVNKFHEDVRRLLDHGVPMPGTLLTRHGLPLEPGSSDRAKTVFPNDLIRTFIHEKILKECHPNNYLHGSLIGIRKILERSFRPPVTICRRKAFPDERFSLRQMMSRYWTNSSPFALDLVGAVIRQGTFIRKMDELNWLHSPALDSTMTRLIQKYKIFLTIIAQNPRETAVPTLDVDLAWHTHQLSPQRYYHYSTWITKNHSSEPRFINHDDKVPETKLSLSFEWTSKQYQKVTDGQIYSECTCWYCEAVREQHNHGMLFPSSQIQQARENAARLRNASSIEDGDRDADGNGPHISSHNALRIKLNKAALKAAEKNVDNLHSAYKKAQRRMAKQNETRSNVERPSSSSSTANKINSTPLVLPYEIDPCIYSGTGGGTLVIYGKCGMYPSDILSVNRGPYEAGNCVAATCSGWMCGSGDGGGGGGGGGGDGGGGDGGGGAGCGGGGGGGGGD